MEETRKRWLGHPTRLHNGKWGACVHGATVRQGDLVDVVPRQVHKTGWLTIVTGVLYIGSSRFCEGVVAVVTTGKRRSLLAEAYQGDNVRSPVIQAPLVTANGEVRHGTHDYQ